MRGLVRRYEGTGTPFLKCIIVSLPRSIPITLTFTGVSIIYGGSVYWASGSNCHFLIPHHYLRGII